MKYVLGLLAAGMLAAALAPASAQAAPSCNGEARSSYFGQIINVNDSFFTLHTNQSVGDVHVYDGGAHIRSDGLNIRPGVYAGVYGCRYPARDALVAEIVTLSQSPSTYPGTWYGTSSDRSIAGRIDAVQQGRILVDSDKGHGDTWVETNQSGFVVGQTVVANGHFSAADRAFIADNVMPYNGGSSGYGNSVQGRISEVGNGRVLIYSNGGHGDLWVVTSAQGLRVGEVIRAVGAYRPQNREFFASSINVVSM